MTHAPSSADLAGGESHRPDRISARPLRLFYFIRVPNVGDRVNPILVTALSGLPTTHSHDEGGHLLAIGSIMTAATPASHVWGTGVMHPDIGIGHARAEHVHAVRGELSVKAMRDAGVPLRDIPLGDPGYLAPKLLGVQRSIRPTFRLGLVPHYVDRFHPHVTRFAQQDDVRILDVHADPVRFLHDMAECEVIVSSSLHGLVFAEALGIPNLWVRIGNEIGGGTFKYEDWFSTTRRPQIAPFEFDRANTVAELADRALCHESTIDEAALINAFPNADAIREPTERAIVPVERCRSSPLPVFFISYNRGQMLRRVIDAMQRLATPTQIIVHDNGSDDDETLAILDELQARGILIYRRGKIAVADELNGTQETVADFFADWAEPQRYIVSDCDVDISAADIDVLAVYDDLLNRFRKVEAVGPMLRLRDVPKSYPLFSYVINRHVEQFWRHLPEIANTPRGPVAFQEAMIDTTFALHRAGESFRRLKSAVRVYEPYEARHLDWYVTDPNPSTYARTSSEQISHWDNVVERHRRRDLPLAFDSYLIVERTASSCLRILQRSVSDHFD